MESNEQIKDMVKRKYGIIAFQGKEDNQASCCGSSCCTSEVKNIMSDDYSTLEGYVPEADLGLGCGLPTQFARIKEGDTVIDLGSGAGNDCFIARSETGESGKVIGIDFTESMVHKARANAAKLGFHNVEFLLGDIEKIPLGDQAANVVVSNCVLNLAPDKFKVFQEVFRVLKPEGHFSISDIVLVGELPSMIKADAEMYAGCVAGAIQKQTYMELIALAGFKDITIQKEKLIVIPDDILAAWLSIDEIRQFRSNRTGIFSITVYGRKPVCP